MNTPSGIVDLRNGEITKNDPAKYFTKITQASPGGDCPKWRRFIDQVTCNDFEYAKFLQRVAGYAATGSIREHALFFIYGAQGAEGKSTFLSTMHAILGDYATVAPLETFTETHNEQHPTNLAMLRGARLVLSQETEEGKAWAETRLKALTGGDPITARFMRADFFTFEPKFKLIIAGNHRPRLRAIDGAIKRRFHLLPFQQSFKGTRCDPDLFEKLQTERDGILRWIVDGAVAYCRDGLNPPQVVRDATDEYFESEDIFEQWLADCCERNANVWEPPGLLFSSWKRYAETHNEKIGNTTSFGGRLATNGFTKANSKQYGGRAWLGLKLTHQTDYEQRY